MTKRIYIQLLAFIAIICYPNNISANDYSLIPSTGQKVYVPLNATSAKGKLLISNYGNTPIENFDYTLSFQGKVLQKKNYILPEPLKRMEGTTVEVDVPPHNLLSETELKIEITKVNGKDNRASINYATMPRVTVTQVARRRVVVEEYTAMWCGYCPRGIAIMENLAKKYPEDFVGIAVHAGDRRDPLDCFAYRWNAANYGRPTLHMNRNLFLVNEIAVNEFEAEKAKGADMDIEVSAMWDEQKENITVTPSVTFRVPKKEGVYGFAYILTEDGMSRPDWGQLNNYAGKKDRLGISEELDYFINAEYWIKGFKNNFVAIEAEGVKSPLTGYITTPIEADKTQSHKYVFQKISRNKNLQDKSKLNVCVLLINMKTGQIENAAKCSISDANTTDISSLPQKENTAVEIERYTIDGHRIMAPQKGINLVKYSDGRVRKEFVTR